jgi:hypothetical protein
MRDRFRTRYPRGKMVQPTKRKSRPDLFPRINSSTAMTSPAMDRITAVSVYCVTSSLGSEYQGPGSEKAFMTCQLFRRCFMGAPHR